MYHMPPRLLLIAIAVSFINGVALGYMVSQARTPEKWSIRGADPQQLYTSLGR